MLPLCPSLSFGRPVGLHFGTPGRHFGTLGGHLGDPGVAGDTPQDTWGSRLGFLSILDGFWDPLGTHFGLMLVTFAGFERLWDDIFPNLMHPDPGLEI